MIDPLGPDPTDPILPARHVGEIVSEDEHPDAPKPSRPKFRFANYDQPEALLRHLSAEESAASGAKSAPAFDSPVLQAPSMSSKPVPDPMPVPAQTALARPVPPLHKRSKLQQAVGVAKTVLPIVAKMLPLLEGNVVSAASNLLTPRPVEVDLKPLEEAIAKLQSDQRALTFHTTEQKRALRQIQDEFEALQESVQKNAEQQVEIAEHLAKLAKRSASFQRLILILLLLSILFTAFLCVRIAYLIRF